MPPLMLIEPDEEFPYVVGDTTFTYRRITPAERDAFRTLYWQRGKIDQEGFDNAVIAIGLVGWANLWGKNGEIAWPTADTPQAQREQVLQVVEKLPLGIAAELLALIRDPSPETLLGNWRALSTGTPTSPTPGPESATPASSADRSAPTPATPCPVTDPAASTPVSTGAAAAIPPANP